jgi:uncharacterized membrane protein
LSRFVTLIALSRGLRSVYRWLAELLGRWYGARAARAVGWASVAVGAALLVSGVLLDGLVAAADEAFSVQNGTTEDGLVQLAGPQRSGPRSSCR